MADSERTQQLQAILAQDPANTFARYALGMEYSGLGDTDAAIATFRELIAHNPDYTNAYFMAAQTLANADRKDEAKKLLQEGLVVAKRTNNRHAENEMTEMLEQMEQ